jgi:hypothetical protein
VVVVLTSEPVLFFCTPSMVVLCAPVFSRKKPATLTHAPSTVLSLRSLLGLPAANLAVVESGLVTAP